MNNTVKIKGGPVIELRKPTEAEVLAHLDKRQRRGAGEQVSADITDDGDAELLAAVTAPPRAAMEELLEDYPRLADQIAERWLALAGSDQMATRDDSVITEAHRKAARRLIGVRVGGRQLVLSKLSRFDVKTLELDAARAPHKQMLRSALAAAAKEHIVDPALPDALLSELPLLSTRLGVLLWNAAQAELEADQGESAAAMRPPAGTPSDSGLSSS